MTLAVSILFFVPMGNASEAAPAEIIVIADEYEPLQKMLETQNVPFSVLPAIYQHNFNTTYKDVALPAECPAAQPIIRIDLHHLSEQKREEMTAQIESFVTEYAPACQIIDEDISALLDIVPLQIMITGTEEELTIIEGVFVGEIHKVEGKAVSNSVQITQLYTLTEGLHPFDLSLDIANTYPNVFAEPNGIIRAAWKLFGVTLPAPTPRGNAYLPPYNLTSVTRNDGSQITPEGAGVLVKTFDNAAWSGTNPRYDGKDFSIVRHDTALPPLLNNTGMQLHGVVVAAELIEKAPEADLELHAILNANGEGTIFQLLEALDQIINQANPNQPMVLNAPIYLSPPLDGLSGQSALHYANDALMALSNPVHFAIAAGNGAPDMTAENYLATVFDNDVVVAGFVADTFGSGNKFGPASFSQGGDIAAWSGGFGVRTNMDRQTFLRHPEKFIWKYIPVIQGVTTSDGFLPVAGTSIATPTVAGALARAAQLDQRGDLRPELFGTADKNYVHDPYTILGDGIFCAERFLQEVANPSVPTDACQVLKQIVPPTLTVESNYAEVSTGDELTLNISLNSADHDISALAFSLPMDSCLTFDKEDTNQDGVINNVTVDNSLEDYLIMTGVEANGQLRIVISDGRQEQHAIDNGRLMQIAISADCATTTPLTTTVEFANVSLGTTEGEDAAGVTRGTTIVVSPHQRGDCNGNGNVASADLSSIPLEIFDQDGNLWLDTLGGTFRGMPVGCDARADEVINAVDISCGRLLVFHGTHNCATVSAKQSRNVAANLTLPQGVVPTDGFVEIPLRLAAHGNSINTIVLSLDFDETQLAYESVRFRSSAGATLVVDSTDQDGELDITLMQAGAISEGELLWLTFRVLDEADQEEAFVRFSADPAPSLGNTDGEGVPLDTQDGSICLNCTPTAVQVQGISANRSNLSLLLLLYSALICLTLFSLPKRKH